MKSHLLNTALNPTVHPAVVSMESFKLIASMEQEIEQQQQADAVANLLETIGSMDDQEKAQELLTNVAALQNIPAEQVSLESIGAIVDTIRKLFGKKKETKEQVNAEPKYLSALMKFLNTYYLNSAWMSKQTFKTGDIAASDIAPRLVRGGKVLTVGELTRYASEFKSFFTKYGEACKKYSADIGKIDDELIAAVKALDSSAEDYEKKVLGLIGNACKKMQALPDPVKQAGTRFKLLDNSQTAIKEWRYKDNEAANCDASIVEKMKDVTVPESLPALTREQVTELVKVVISLYETTNFMNEISLHFADHSDGDHGFMKIAEGKDEKLWMQYMGLMYWQGQRARLKYDFRYETNTVNGVLAILKWIDRSIEAN